MKISLELKPVNNCDISYNYNYSVYSFITSICDKKHDEKIAGKFTFLLDFPKENVYFCKDKVLIKKSVYLYISSDDDYFIMAIANGIKLDKEYKIENFNFTVGNTQLNKQTYTNKKYKVELLTPVLVFDQENNVRCLNIFDEKYSENLIKNIKTKVGQNVNVDLKFLINEHGYKKRITEIKNGGKVTGYLYTFEISVDDPSVLYKLFESGFGGKNSFGFGFAKII